MYCSPTSTCCSDPNGRVRYGQAYSMRHCHAHQCVAGQRAAAGVVCLVLRAAAAGLLAAEVAAVGTYLHIIQVEGTLIQHTRG